MLVTIPGALYGRIGAMLSALIVAACVVGLTMHRDFYAGIPRRDFFCFYTNLSNLLVLVYFALIAPRLYAFSPPSAFIPHAEFSLMMSIMLTFSVFHLMLYPAVRAAIRNADRTREYMILCTDNFIIHYLVPWLVFFYWLLCSPGKERLGFFDVFYWMLFPLLYLLFIFLRAANGKRIEETDSLYPYPFLDASVLGKQAVLRLCFLLSMLCAAVSGAIIAITKLLLFLFGSGHSLLLI